MLRHSSLSDSKMSSIMSEIEQAFINPKKSITTDERKLRRSEYKASFYPLRPEGGIKEREVDYRGYGENRYMGD